MKVNLPTKQLASALKTLNPIAKASRTHPILGNVALIAEKKGLRLVAMDLEKRMELFLSCKPKEVGSITLNCAYLNGLLSSRSEPECEISTKDNTATLRIGRHVGNRPGLPFEEMPDWSESTTKASEFTIPAKLWNESLSKSLVQSNTGDGERAVLNSVVLVSREGQLCIQATNGQRLIIHYTPVPFDCSAEAQFFIPRESVPGLCSLATEGDIAVSVSEGVLTASTDAARVSTKLIEASFADFERVFPKKRIQSVKCNRETLLMEVASAANYIQEQPPKIRLEFDGKEMTVVGSDDKQQNGEGCGMLDATGDVMRIFLNPIYLTDALRAFEDETIAIEFNPEPMCIVIKNDSITTSIGLQKG